MRFQSALAAAVLFAVSLFSAAEATPINYTIGGHLTGTLNGHAFFDRPFAWTLTSDTTAWTFSAPYYVAPATSAVINLHGFGVVTPTLPQFYFSAPGIGFGEFADATNTQGTWFASYLLDGYMGWPTAPLFVGVHGLGALSTDLGDLVITDSNFTHFMATIVTPSYVPEPATIALAAFGLLGAIAARRRKQKA